MKKIVTILFAIQLLVISFYGVAFFRGDAYNNIISDGRAVFDFHFGNDENFHFFLETLESVGIDASRIIFHRDDDLSVFTTDLTLDDLISINSGRFPEPETAEFISNFDTSDVNQVGQINDILPGFRLTISPMNNLNFTRDGTYYLHTSDEEMLRYLIDAFETHLPYVHVLSRITPNVSPLIRLAHGFGLGFQIIEFFALSFILFLCMVLSVLQYGITQLKGVSIQLLHGYGKSKILKLMMLSFLKPLGIGFVSGYVLTLAHSLFRGYNYFITTISAYFFIIGISFISIYLLVGVISMGIYLKSLRNSHIVKGKKPIGFVQVGNHILKASFILYFITAFTFSLDMFHQLRTRIHFTNAWEKTQGIYQLPLSTWWNDEAVRMEKNRSLFQFYAYLTQNHYGFLLNTYLFETIDSDDEWHRASRPARPEVDPSGYRITISPNFLNFNPIETTSNIPIHDQIIWDFNVLNILVPDHLSVYEDEILQNYLREFQMIQARERELIEAGLDATSIMETNFEQPEINIIYVENGQYYMSMNIHVRPATGGLILDPIAVIHTGNIAPTHFDSWISLGLYFQSEGINPYTDVFPTLQYHDLDGDIRQARSVFNQYVRVVNDLQEQMTRLTFFIILLVTGSVTVTYHLMANYFEMNKFKLTIKRHFGYHPLKRNQKFVASFLGYSLPIVILASWLLGWVALFIGVAVLITDILVGSVFERYLMKKSFAEIMKGER